MIVSAFAYEQGGSKLSQQKKNTGRQYGRDQIIQLMTGLFPPQWFTRWRVSLSRGWTPQKVLWVSLIMHWLPERALRERFVRARQIIKRLHPRWDLPISYSGFVEAQLRTMQQIGPEVQELLRPDDLWADNWMVHGWLLLAVDGTKFECPRTQANEEKLGCAGAEKSCPQVFQTTILHLGTGVPWDFELGPGIESERRQLDRMLNKLPDNAMLVADAGFISFKLCHSLMRSGKAFVLRVAANMRLVEGLSEHCTEVRHESSKDLTCLWPKGETDQQPVLLRRVTVTGASGVPIVLVTNILDTEILPDSVIVDIYRKRWGLEIHYRNFKQTWHFAALNSRTAGTAISEQWWRFISMWTLHHIAAHHLVVQKMDPLDVSGAALRRIIRALLNDAEAGRKSSLFQDSISKQRRDRAPRKKPKCRRPWPRKSAHKEPKPPKLRQASTTEVQRAIQLGFLFTATG